MSKKGSKPVDDGETLFVTVMNAKNITAEGKKVDAFCKVHSSFNQQRFKTKVAKKTASPSWD